MMFHMFFDLVLFFQIVTSKPDFSNDYPNTTRLEFRGNLRNKKFTDLLNFVYEILKTLKPFSWSSREIFQGKAT